jgi:DNA-binding response OmpR family regulator
LKQRSIVIVEDEEHILEVISYNLKREGFAVRTARDGEDGLSLIRSEFPDLVVLDIMLPGIDGLDVCQRIKADPSLRAVPVIMVTAKSEESDVVLGLGVGADDYIVKPFSPRELVARVKAALRRGPWRKDEGGLELIETAGIRIDSFRHEVSVDGEATNLTPSEFRMLYQLAAAPGRVFSRDELLSQLGGGEAYVLERNIDTHIKSIRRKLGTRRELIETVRGVGYRFRTAHSDAAPARAAVEGVCRTCIADSSDSFCRRNSVAQAD